MPNASNTVNIASSASGTSQKLGSALSEVQVQSSATEASQKSGSSLSQVQVQNSTTETTERSGSVLSEVQIQSSATEASQKSGSSLSQVQVQSFVIEAVQKSGSVVTQVEVQDEVVPAPVIRIGHLVTEVQLEKSSDGVAIHSWWRAQYIYRRNIDVLTFGESIPAGHPVIVKVPLLLSKNRKIRSDLEDLEVIYVEDAEIYHLSREVRVTDEAIEVGFLLYKDIPAESDISGQYFVYHGNRDLIQQPIRPDPPNPSLFPQDTAPTYQINPWPVQAEQDGGRFGYTRPGEHWLAGESEVRGARATLMLYASDMRVISEVGPDRGILEIRLDGGPWEDVNLFSSDVDIVPVFEAINLSAKDVHEVVMRVSGRSKPPSLGHSVNVKRVEYLASIEGIDVGESVTHLFWKTTTGG